MKQKPQPKNKPLLIALISLISIVLPAQNIGTLFMNMPDSYIPTLSQVQRFELLEYSKSNRTDSTKNRFGNNVSIQLLDTTNKCIALNTTPTSRIELKVLNENTIGVIYSVKSPINISTVKFYDLNWLAQPITFEMPQAWEWLNEELIAQNKMDRELLLKLLNNGFISLSFAQTDSVIEATNNTLEFLSLEDKKLIKPYLLEKKLTYQLEANKWIKSK